jgi:hypothetical protein
MPRCASFVHSRHHAAAFSRCTRRTRRGDLFCTRHRDILNGAIMGALHATEPIHVDKTEIEKAGPEADSAKIALEGALALLTVPPIGLRRRRSSSRAGRSRKTAQAEAGAAPSPPTDADRRSAA